MQHQPDFLDALVLKAVRRYIADAIQSQSIVSASDCAAEILMTYPSCRLDRETVADEVIMAAAKAGVPVESGGRVRAKARRKSHRAGG